MRKGDWMDRLNKHMTFTQKTYFILIHNLFLKRKQVDLLPKPKQTVTVLQY